MKIYWYLIPGSLRPTDVLHPRKAGGWYAPGRSEGQAIGVVRKWWRNYLVVALDSGAIVEVPAKYCRMVL